VEKNNLEIFEFLGNFFCGFERLYIFIINFFGCNNILFFNLGKINIYYKITIKIRFILIKISRLDFFWELENNNINKNIYI
jgi:hypothetical protein